MSSGGSSPLTRGKPARRGLEGMVRRLIPAHAGKTRQAACRSSQHTAHPRSRGENTWLLPRGQRARGSSPLTRGKPPHLRALARWGRLIPAHAGKTNTLITTMFYNKAHPRSRGENTALVSQRFQFGNSSPLTRGKHSVHSRLACGSRLIPAHAGKTCPYSRSTYCLTAHPRSRGENFASGALAVCRWGSSPLTRGKRRCPHGERAVRGLIPAHAGKTYRRWTAVSSPTAHPRSRGENVRLRPMCLWTTGSSPLTRGKLLTIL